MYFPYIHRIAIWVAQIISISLIYRNHFFSLAFPSPQYFCINAFIYSTVQIMVFFLYMRISLFFSYISCYNIPYRCFSIYISIKDTPFLFYFAQIVNFCILPIYNIKDILFLLVPPQNLCVFSYIYSVSYIYIVKTLFFFVFCPELSIQLFSYIYNKHSFFLSQTLPRLVPSAHFSYIQTTLFSLVFAQYLSYIMYYSYIYRINTYFFSLFQARFPRYYVFLIYIIKTA